MKTYIIDFDAWTTIEAENEEHALSIGQVIINACKEAFQDTNIELNMIVRDGGIEEEN
jgi:hypothetical protein